MNAILKMIRILGLVLLVLVVSACHKHQKQPNILFICVDDLRPELGCYGADHIHSPHLDELAKSGTAFRQHYVQVPTCGASRYSMLTGKLPESKQHLSNDACKHFITGKPESERPETFVHHLRNHGYYTVGIGKISHYPDGMVYGYQEPKSTVRELPHSWDEMLFDHGKWGSGHNAFFGYADGTNRNDLNKLVKPYEKAEVDDEGYPDGLTAKLAIQKIQELKEQDKPFFLGVGFFKPHLPFTAPKKYWDLYNVDSIPLSQVRVIPQSVSKKSLHSSGEFNQYKLGKEKASLDRPVSEDYERKVRHAYFACVSYVDAQIGKVLEGLEKAGLSDNTIVVVWGDHGWHLGDQLVWGKHTVFEKALKSTLILKVPQKQQMQSVKEVVSSIDLYPTLCELTGIQKPDGIDGKSLVDVLTGHAKNWQGAAYGYFQNGISVRTDHYRLTRYFRGEEMVNELYDHRNHDVESRNIAEDEPAVVERLLPIWEQGNTGLYK
jgi:arylsulfatase A-like enzyme